MPAAFKFQEFNCFAFNACGVQRFNSLKGLKGLKSSIFDIQYSIFKDDQEFKVQLPAAFKGFRGTRGEEVQSSIFDVQYSIFKDVQEFNYFAFNACGVQSSRGSIASRSRV
jgi:hypothetical protein